MSHHLVFSDLKPENVLVHQTGHVKLTDFGSARYCDKIVEGDRIEGTAEYLAPGMNQKFIGNFLQKLFLGVRRRRLRIFGHLDA